MFRFSEIINDFLGKELITKDNEQNFLNEFNEACHNLDLSEGDCSATVIVFGKQFPINFLTETDCDGIVGVYDIELDTV